MNYLEGLNDDQRQAVTHVTGPVSIIAGPGTGKTKTLTSRIVYLMESKRATPDAILALTFTNKAAKEMKERVGAVIGAKLPHIHTFHGFALSILQDRLSDMQPVHASVRSVIVRQLKQHFRITDKSVRDLELAISKAKNTVEQCSVDISEQLITEYNRALADRDVYDYDDLLYWLFTHFQNHPEDAQKYSYVLVDEFQDTNELQFAIIRQLSQKEEIFVIGDPLQSIYGFRGASAAIFDAFHTQWPQAHKMTLRTNYRSVAPIVRLSNALFPGHHILESFRSDGTGICKAVETLNEYGEADYVLHAIETAIGGSTMQQGSVHHASSATRSFRDFAIIYRTHAQSRCIQKTFEASGLPYQVAGEGTPYEHPDIQAVLHGLAYIVHNLEPQPYKDLTTQQIKVLLDHLAGGHLPLMQVVEAIGSALGIGFATVHMRQFTQSLLAWNEKNLDEYLIHVADLAAQAYYDPSAEAITLLTIHASKGLEFPVVFLAGTEEGLLPLVRKGIVTDNDEERRLLYVAITRARDELYVLHARRRGGEQATLSSFLSPIDSQLLPRMTDPAAAAQRSRASKRMYKQAQTSMF